MSGKNLKCPVQGCGRDAEFIQFECEEIPMPTVMKASELRYKAPFGELRRNFLVECPVHGQNYVQQSGHHVTNRKKVIT